MVLKQWIVGLLLAFAGITSVQASWSEAAQVGNDVHIFRDDPARMERYDLVNVEWKETVTLPEKAGGLTAAHADEDGVYLAYGSALYRYDLEGENEAFVLSQVNPIFRIVSLDKSVVAFSGTSNDGQAVSFLKSNNGVADTRTNLRINELKPEEFTAGGAPGEIYYPDRWGATTILRVDNSGKFVTTVGIQFQSVAGQSINSQEVGRFFHFPGRKRGMGSQGRGFNGFLPNISENNRYFVSMGETGLAPRDVVVLGNDVPVVLEATRVVGLRNNLSEAGSQELSFRGERIFRVGDEVVVFGEEAEGGLAVEAISLLALGNPQPGEPIDAEGLRFEPEHVFVDGSGIVNLFSRQYAALFRWNPETQEYARTINLADSPYSYFYSPTRDRFYFAVETGQKEGAIRYLELDEAEPTERTLVARIGGLDLIADAGSNVYSQERNNGSGTLYRSNGTVQATGNNFVSNDGYGAAGTLWDGSTRRLIDAASGSVRALPLPGSSFGQPIYSSGGFEWNANPLVIAPGRRGLILSSGEIASLSNYEKIPTALGNAVLDATVQGADVKTIREINELTQLQSWDGLSLAPGAVKQVPGTPLAVDRVDVDSLVAVTMGEDGVPSFYFLENDLTVIPPENLEVPAGLHVEVTGPGSVLVTWLDVSGEEEFLIERRVSGSGEFEEVGSVSTSVTRFDDEGLAGLGTNYEYRVVAVNGDLKSAPSGVVEVRFELPGEISGLQVVDLEERSATVIWERLDAVSGYEVEALWVRNFSSVVRANPQPAASATSYTFSGVLSLDSEYQFRVRGVNGLGAGPWTSLNDRTLPPIPTTPYNLLVSGTPTSYSVDLRWSVNTNGLNFVLERRGAGEADFVEVYQGTSSSYRDLDLDPLTRYSYRVRSENVRGVSDYSEVVDATTTELLPPGAPRGIFAMNVVGGIRVNWNYNWGGNGTFTTATSIILERRNDEGSDRVLLAELPWDEVDSFLDETAVPGFQYRYFVRGKNASGESADERFIDLLAIDGDCLLAEDFDQGILNPLLEVAGGELVSGGGEGFAETGVLFFAGGFERSLMTVPLDLRFGGSIDLRGRVGDDQGSEPGNWNAPDESNELPVIEYLNLDETNGVIVSEANWRNMGYILPFNTEEISANGAWETGLIRIQPISSRQGVVIRIRQRNFDGPGLDTFAIDRLCIFGHRGPNNIPVLDPTMPVTLTANPTGDSIRMNFSQWVTEEDNLDRVYFEIGAVSNPAIFSEFTVDLETGILNLEFAPQATGSSTLEVVTNDSAGGSVSHTFTVNAPTLHAPTIVREGLVELNSTTGKYEQTLTIANNGPRGIAGIQVVVTSLNNGFVLDGHENNIAVSNSPLGPGETVSLVLEYHSEVSGVAPRPDFEVQILSPEGEAQSPGGGEAALRELSDSSKLFSFDAVVGQTYVIEYSYDMIAWQTSPVTVTAGANRAQWLDQGPPKTDCHPSECVSRFYRVVPVTNE